VKPYETEAIVPPVESRLVYAGRQSEVPCRADFGENPFLVAAEGPQIGVACFKGSTDCWVEQEGQRYEKELSQGSLSRLGRLRPGSFSLIESLHVDLELTFPAAQVHMNGEV